MAGRLVGKVALITGGASGIGAAHARLFVDEGAKVVVADVQEDLGRQVVQRLGEDGYFVRLDVANENEWQNAVRETVERFGKLTTLVNNAGIYRPTGVESETQETWDKVVSVCQTGVWLGMKAAIPEIRKAGGGAIVNISSVYGIIGSPNMFSYHAAKGAVRLMTKAAALEYAKQNIRINSVHPGIINTPIVGSLTEDTVGSIQAFTPLGRMGRPEEIAWGSVFLCSDEASFVTGTELIIDGGWTAQ
jgi:NAD(P)-dependent dehydrogenase (short-subunit alcohol dehydrogenase family)